METVHDTGKDIWADGLTAAAIFAVDPVGLSGVALRAPAGAVRDQWLARLAAMLPQSCTLRRIPHHADDARLLGGLDLAATLARGQPVLERGLLSQCDGGIAVLAMAERIDSQTAARFATALDTREVLVERDGMTLRQKAAFGVVLLDEGIDADELPPTALLDRVAIRLDLSAMAEREIDTIAPRLAAVSADDIEKARRMLPTIQVGAEVLEALTVTALTFGVPGLRAPLFALKVARAAAALRGCVAVDAPDAQLAARLVLAPRATTCPAPPPQDAPDDASENQDPDEHRADDATRQTPPSASSRQQSMEDVVLAATEAAIPAGLLQRLLQDRRGAEACSSGTSGRKQSGANRGRTVGVRSGNPRAGRSMNILATLRAAAPWQVLRKRERAGAGTAPTATPDENQVHVRKEDFRIHRYEQRAETTTIFVVDASGSQALHRLGEAKGAVELLLADCYVRRDRVAVISFRGRTAEILLPPTRSLARAKRSLAALPGGGGTPLANGLDAARSLADGVSRRGETPLVVLLTDGRANVARNGEGGRTQAEADALGAARSLRATRATGMVIDTSPNGQAQASAVASAMGAIYLPLPHANARGLSQAVSGMLRATPAGGRHG